MKVIYANKDNMGLINSILNKNNVVVFFTAPWCGHCKNLKPVMENVFGRFKNMSNTGSIVNVSEHEMPRITLDNKIDGFPTIRHYNNGNKVNDYSGMRDEKSLTNYLVKIFEENKMQNMIREKKTKKKAKRKSRRRRFIKSLKKVKRKMKSKSKLIKKIKNAFKKNTKKANKTKRSSKTKKASKKKKAKAKKKLNIQA